MVQLFSHFATGYFNQPNFRTRKVQVTQCNRRFLTLMYRFFFFFSLLRYKMIFYSHLKAIRCKKISQTCDEKFVKMYGLFKMSVTQSLKVFQIRHLGCNRLSAYTHTYIVSIFLIEKISQITIIMAVDEEFKVKTFIIYKTLERTRKMFYFHFL